VRPGPPRPGGAAEAGADEQEERIAAQAVGPGARRESGLSEGGIDLAVGKLPSGGGAYLIHSDIPHQGWLSEGHGVGEIAACLPCFAVGGA